MEEGTNINSAMKSDKPIPSGAMNVPRCFSAANMNMVKTNWIVKNISINSP